MGFQKLSQSAAKRASYILITVGVLTAAGGFLSNARDHHTATQPPGAMQHMPSAIKPNPKSVAAYEVAPDLPKYIAIPSIGVTTTRIVQLGLMKNNQIAVPDNIYDTGWYNRSAKPGQAGAMFMYGHVSSWQANGVFYNLKKLKPGETITITQGNNKTYTYKVVTSKPTPTLNVNMNEVLSPISTSASGLNLMTCAGQVMPGTSEFNERLVVFASLVS